MPLSLLVHPQSPLHWTECPDAAASARREPCLADAVQPLPLAEARARGKPPQSLLQAALTCVSRVACEAKHFSWPACCRPDGNRPASPRAVQAKKERLTCFAEVTAVDGQGGATVRLAVVLPHGVWDERLKWTATPAAAMLLSRLEEYRPPGQPQPESYTAALRRELEAAGLRPPPEGADPFRCGCRERRCACTRPGAPATCITPCPPHYPSPAVAVLLQPFGLLPGAARQGKGGPAPATDAACRPLAAVPPGAGGQQQGCLGLLAWPPFDGCPPACPVPLPCSWTCPCFRASLPGWIAPRWWRQPPPAATCASWRAMWRRDCA